MKTVQYTQYVFSLNILLRSVVFFECLIYAGNQPNKNQRDFNQSQDIDILLKQKH